MRTYNPMNLWIENSTLITDWMNEGIIIVSDCSLLNKNAIWGTIMIR